METLPQSLLTTHAGQAAVTAAWADGIPQKHIARVFGYKNNSAICRRIEQFIRVFYPESITRGIVPQADERIAPANVAIARYLQQRGL
jgi:hypothetical protein